MHSICKQSLFNMTFFSLFSLYEKSVFVDLKFITSGGRAVYCHQLFISGRVPVVWLLLSQIVKHQLPHTASPRGTRTKILIINLPTISYDRLEPYIRLVVQYYFFLKLCRTVQLLVSKCTFVVGDVL